MLTCGFAYVGNDGAAASGDADNAADEALRDEEASVGLR